MHEFMYKVVVLHLVVAYVRTREFVAPYHSSAAAGYGLPRVADKQQYVSQILLLLLRNSTQQSIEHLLCRLRR